MNKPRTPLPHETAHDADADVREFDDYARGQDAVALQASLWATRRHQGLDAPTEAAFQAWLAASPAHAEAYDELVQSFGRVRGLPKENIEALNTKLRSPQVTARQPSPSLPATRPGSTGRRAWPRTLGSLFPQAATAAIAATLVVGGWMGWDHWRRQATFVQNYATERGQRLNLDLPDGSTLELDAATRAEVRLYRHRREVRLVDGQAMFTVQRKPDQPFDVLAGQVRVTVVGTRFSVRATQSGLDAGKTVVAVESGRVRVSGLDQRDGSELTAGQGVSADGSGRLEAIVSLPSAGVAAWRQGRVSFNDTPLAQALVELERYGSTGLVVRDPAVGALRLGGSFDVKRIDTFAKALPLLLPVRLERRGGSTEILGSR